jgi:nitrous oxide reductase accessory protein NosL
MAQRSQTLALLFVALLLAGCDRGAKVCAVCQRDECKAMAFRVTLENGKTVETCCPRCGMHYVEAMKQPARSLEATDFTTGHWVDATKATFVSGSDMKGCAMPAAQRDAQGCCMYMAYDRCLPSLVAFADKPAAMEFQKQHGGDVQSFAELSAIKSSSVSK